MAQAFIVKLLELADKATQESFLEELRKFGVPVSNCTPVTPLRDKINEKIGQLSAEATALEAKAKRSQGTRDAGMSEHFAAQNKRYAVTVLRELLDG